MISVSLYKTRRSSRKNPNRLVWQIRWKGTDGKRFCETIDDCSRLTKRQAEAIRRDKQSKIDCGVVPPNRPRRITLAALIEQDKAAIEGDVRPTTMLEYGHATAHAFEALGRDIPIDRVGPAEVGRVKKYLRDLDRAQETIRKTIRALSAIFRRALDQQLIHRNPFAGQAKGKTQAKRKRIYSRQEVIAMLAVCRNAWWELFVNLAVRTGLRKGELLNLTWQDVDFEAARLTVSRKDRGRFKIKGEAFPILAWQAKTYEERSVPFDPDVTQMLRREKLQAEGSVYVFLTLERLRRIDEHLTAGTWRAKADLVNDLDRAFKALQRAARRRIAREAGRDLADVPWPLGSVHDLRRTWATHMAAHVNTLTLCEWGGWANAKTCQQFYHKTTAAIEDRGRRAMFDLYRVGESDAQVTRKPSGDDQLASTGTENAVPATMDAVSARSSIG